MRLSNTSQPIQIITQDDISITCTSRMLYLYKAWSIIKRGLAWSLLTISAGTLYKLFKNGSASIRIVDKNSKLFVYIKFKRFSKYKSIHIVNIRL